MSYIELVSKASRFRSPGLEGDVVHGGVGLSPRVRSVVLQLRHSVQIPLQSPEIFLKLPRELKG